MAQVERLSTIRNGIASESNSHSIPLGSSVSLECEVSGTPTPTVEWTRDGVSITDEATQTLNSISNLSVSTVTVSESGIYQCHVENVHGRDSRTVFLCFIEQEGRYDIQLVREREKAREKFNMHVASYWLFFGINNIVQMHG